LVALSLGTEVVRRRNADEKNRRSRKMPSAAGQHGYELLCAFLQA
jgi:hypothetical protein